ncbi:MAG: SNF2 helicase-associated domain-containing protein [Ectobacillus sp.]
MKLQSDITLRLERVGNGWMLFGEDEMGTAVSPEHWRQHAFLWHTSSFHGTFLTEGTYKGTSGISLTPKQALEFVAARPANSFAELRYSQDLQAAFPLMKQAWNEYQDGAFLPDMNRWSEEAAWKPEHTHLGDPLLQTLFSEAVNYALAAEPSANAAWEKALRLYEHRSSSIKLLSTAVNEEDWLKKIGYLEDDTPFTIGLRLLEPQEDFAPWQLETILLPKRGAQRTYVYKDEKSLPKRWQAYNNRILQAYEGWEKLVPWLVEDGQLRHELYEQEAWRFLTEASNELLAAGVDILLPSWWQALKANKLSLRAKVKGNSHTRGGQSFFGMNTLISFDWRIATEGIELSEEEFQRLIDQNRRLININGQWIRLDPEFIEHVKKLMDKADKYGLEMKDLLQQELLRSAQPEQTAEEDHPFSEIEIELDDYYESLFNRLTEIGSVPERKAPSGLQAALRPYQQKGLEWLLYLRELGFGALLADDMGLGSAKRSHISVA